MVTLISLIILIASFLGITFVLIRKIPLIAQLPKTEIVSEPFLARMKNKVKPIEMIKNLPLEGLLQKFLSKLRVATLKLEGKTAVWLAELRKRSLTKNGAKKDNYWEKFKNNKDGGENLK